MIWAFLFFYIIFIVFTVMDFGGGVSRIVWVSSLLLLTLYIHTFLLTPDHLFGYLRCDILECSALMLSCRFFFFFVLLLRIDRCRRSPYPDVSGVCFLLSISYIYIDTLQTPVLAFFCFAFLGSAIYRRSVFLLFVGGRLIGILFFFFLEIRPQTDEKWRRSAA